MLYQVAWNCQQSVPSVWQCPARWLSSLLAPASGALPQALEGVLLLRLSREHDTSAQRCRQRRRAPCPSAGGHHSLLCSPGLSPHQRCGVGWLRCHCCAAELMSWKPPAHQGLLAGQRRGKPTTDSESSTKSPSLLLTEDGRCSLETLKGEPAPHRAAPGPCGQHRLAAPALSAAQVSPHLPRPPALPGGLACWTVAADRSCLCEAPHTARVSQQGRSIHLAHVPPLCTTALQLFHIKVNTLDGSVQVHTCIM